MLNDRKRRFAEAYANAEDGVLAAQLAGYPHPRQAAQRHLADPEMRALIRQEQVTRLETEALPAAINCLISIVTDAQAPAGARVQASKVILDRTLGSVDGGAGKELHEMTADELQRQREEILMRLADLAKPVIEGAIAQPAPNVFD